MLTISLFFTVYYIFYKIIKTIARFWLNSKFANRGVRRNFLRMALKYAFDIVPKAHFRFVSAEGTIVLEGPGTCPSENFYKITLNNMQF